MRTSRQDHRQQQCTKCNPLLHKASSLVRLRRPARHPGQRSLT
jgi:hypothetical protein